MSAPVRAHDRMDALTVRAGELFPGGVNSPVRAFRATGHPPVLLARGEGPWVWDADGRRYLDLISSWGASILGHAYPAITEAVRDAAANGMALGATHPGEIELGEAIRDAMPSIERLRFTSSGTEAVMSAVRLARAATGRDLVVKFAGAYHGHSDGLLADAGSGVATLGIPGSAGVPEAVAQQTIVLPFNDTSTLTLAFERYAPRIAAVVTEPVIANAGVIAPQPGFLAHLRQITRTYGALLIFDEVISGFRLGSGGAQARFDIRPELTTLGKVIGGGMPIGAYGGTRELMALIAPSGPVYQAGTLSGHPLAMAAGIATLAELEPQRYLDLEARVDRLVAGLTRSIERHGREASVARVGPLLTLYFRAVPPTDADEAFRADREAWSRFFRTMLESGVLLPPSPFEAWFPGFAHGDDEIDLIIAAADRALTS